MILYRENAIRNDFINAKEQQRKMLISFTHPQDHEETFIKKKNDVH